MTGTVVCFIAALLVGVAQALTSVEDLQGEYLGQITFPTFVSIDDEGRVTNYCRDQFTQECLDSVPPPVERVVVDNNTISFTIVHLPGIDTREKSIEAFPACASGGIYPINFVGLLPPAPIQSYDPTNGHLTFIDPRRPDDLNCAIINLEEGKEGKSIRAKYLLVSENIPEIDILNAGPNFRCIIYNDLCIAETSQAGNFVSFVDLEFQLPCTAGACMDSE